MTAGDLLADRGQIERFANAIFAYADPGTHIALRGFDQFDSTKPPVESRGTTINGSMACVVDAALASAQRCADHAMPSVFCPPLCTFTSAGKARTIDLANGLALSVECDEWPNKARTRLEAILGPCTMAVASGSTWPDPDTGEVQDKLHLHWRLSEPTREAADHEMLKLARDMACQLAGADPTGRPVVHPLRWPGSWNVKGRPTMALIVAENVGAELHLVEALGQLEDAIESLGLKAEGLPPQSSSPQADPALIASAMAAIPNLDVHYDQWIKLGYACCRATGGSPDGFTAWDSWSQTSSKYDAAETEAAWRRVCAAVAGGAPSKTAGAGTIFFLGKQAGWSRPNRLDDAKPDPDTQPKPEPETEPKPEQPDMLENPDMSVLRLNRRPPPTLPIEVFGPSWADWIATTAEAAACPPDYVAAPLLSIASVLIGNARWAEAWPGWTEPPHLWTCAVGDSGSSKSPGADVLLRDVLPTLEERMNVNHPDAMRAWTAAAEADKAARESWEDSVRKAQRGGLAVSLPPTTTASEKPETPRLRQNDVTIEKVAVLLASAAPKGLLVHRDELLGWVAGMSTYNDAGRAFWIESFGGRPYRVERQKHPEPIDVPRLAVAVFGGTQPAKVAGLLNDADDGLLGRIFWFWPNPVPFAMGEAAPGVPWAIDALDHLRRLELLPGDGAKAPSRPVLVTLDIAARSDMVTFGVEMQARQEASAGLMQSAYGKARGLALRLSLVLTYLQWVGDGAKGASPTVIASKDFAAAVHLVADYLIPMAERVYGDAATRQEDRDAATLARWIIKTRPTEVHVRTLQRSVRLPGLNMADAIHAAAAVLTDAGWLVPPRPGSFQQRARAAYQINQRIYEVPI